MPTPAYTALTRGKILANIVRRGGVGMGYVTEGTNTAASASTPADATTGSGGFSRFNAANDPRIILKPMYIYDGTKAGEWCVLSAFTASTSGTALPNFSGNLSTDSKYIIYGSSTTPFTPPVLERMIQDAAAAISFDKESRRGIFIPNDVYREIQIGNALVNPLFDLYTTANVPDGWTNVGTMTLTSETNVTYGGCRRSLKCVCDGANVGRISQALPEIGRWANKSVTAWAWVYCTTANDIRLQILDAVSQTVTSSDYHGGTGWERLSVTHTVASTTTTLTVRVGQAAVQGTTFYVQNIYFPRSDPTDHSYAIDADLSLVALSPDLLISGQSLLGSSVTGAGNFSEEYKGKWEVVYETTRKIRLHMGSEYNGRVLEYKGWKVNSELTAVTSTWNAAQATAVEEYVLMLVALQTIGQPLIDLGDERMKIIRKYGTQLPAGARILEPSA